MAVLRMRMYEMVRIRKRSLAHAPDRRPPRRLLAVLPIGGQIERDEQDQVRAENADASEGSELLARAFSSIGQPWPVSGCEVGPGREVHED